MAFDALSMMAAVDELRREITGYKIDKIHQPERDEFILALRGPGEAKRLLLSASRNNGRIQLIKRKKENPENPPMFCMLLRKHLQGGRIMSITQVEAERICDMEIETLNEMGERSKKHLILEVMGQKTNLVLTDAEGRIIDCVRKVDGPQGPERYPMLYWKLPVQKKKNPMSCSVQMIKDGMAQANEGIRADKWLLDTFLGISPLVSREVVFRANTEDKLLGELTEAEKTGIAAEFVRVLECAAKGEFVPTMLKNRDEPFEFSFMDICQYGTMMEKQVYSSFSELMEEFYSERDINERMKQRSRDLVKKVSSAREREERKLVKRMSELESSKDREKYKRKGDLITAHLYCLERGMSRFTAVDYWTEGCPEVTVELDPLLSPQQNAEKCFRNYRKAQTAEKMLGEQIERGRREKEYLESVLEAISKAESESDLQEIRRELTETGYLRKTKQKTKKTAFAPRVFESSSGFKIAAGKNNTQNDMLTLKTAGREDLWFHTQKIHGSHVILFTEGKEPDGTALKEAAMIAAYYSKAQDGSNVPVDYTKIRFVKKPGGARPGMVIYDKYHTLYVTPDKSAVEKLEKASH